MPSKFVYRKGRLRASTDRNEIGVGSRLNAGLAAEMHGRHLPKHAKGRLLDLGCGKVPLLEVYEPRVTEITCADRSDSLHGNRHVDVVCDLMDGLPFEDGSFDTVLLFDVLEHLPEPETGWAEMARVLSPGGVIVLSVPFLYWLHETPNDYYRFTEHALRRFVERAGLQLLVLEPIGGAPEVLVDISAKVLGRVRKLGTAAAMVLQGLASLLLRSPPGRNLSRRTARAFPLGYYLVACKRDSAG